jgi:Tfp pilus assembly protein PilF
MTSPALVSTLLLAAADEPTWARDVAPILFEHCAPCHRPGEVAPFSLLTADDAADHAAQIARVTKSRYMPPWLAEPGDPPFVGARRLTDEQIETLERWARAGARGGDLAAAPAPPEFPGGWRLGEPDLVLTMPEPFVLPPEGRDVYRHFVIPVPVESLKYVRGVDLKPGNARVVHHAALKLDKTDSSRRHDAEDPLPGFARMEWGEARSPDGHFVGWTPGRTPQTLPEGMSWRLTPGSDIVLQLHMLPSGKPETVQASVGLYFTDAPPKRVPFILRLGSKAIDIPAGAHDWELADRFTLPVGVKLCSLSPHAHFLGRSVRCSVTLPGGATRELLQISHWDFGWQDEFRFVEPVPLPAGATLEMVWTYDNSEENPRNPHRPPQRVSYGSSSLEEMCDLWVQVLPESRADFDKLRSEFVRKDLALLRAGCEARLARSPDDADCHLEFGLVLLQQGDEETARREFERTLELAPERAQAHHHLGALLARRNDAAGARARFERVLELEPGHALARVQMGVLAESAGDVAAARASYERALELAPRLFSARHNLGRLLDRGGEDRAASQHYEVAIAVDPGAEDVRRALAWLLSTSPEEAARDGERAVALALALVNARPQEPLELDVLAAAQAECRRFEAAAKTAARAAELARRRGAAAFAARIEARRELYLRSQAYREVRGEGTASR